MKALVYTDTETVELQELPPPTPADGEVLLEVLAAGICGSELEGVRTPNPMRVPPLVMGHELVGRRTDNGEVVAVNPLLSCGACDACLRGDTNLCRRRELIGVHRAGGFAELVAVPSESCQPLPDNLDVSAAALAEPIANGIHAIARARRHLHGEVESVGVIGGGMLGIASALVASREFDARVTVADLDDDRLARGAAALDVETATKLEGEFDLVVDAVGSAATRATAVDSLRPGGLSIWIGLHHSDPGFDGLGLVRQERMVCGTFAYTNPEFVAALELCADVDPGWAEQVQLEDSAAAFTDLMRSPGAAPRTILVP